MSNNFTSMAPDLVWRPPLKSPIVTRLSPFYEGNPRYEQRNLKLARKVVSSLNWEKTINPREPNLFGQSPKVISGQVLTAESVVVTPRKEKK